MAVRIHDVAVEVGVSPSTVSRVLNNKGSISDATRRRVLTTASEMGYSPRGGHRRSNVGSSSKVVSVLIGPHILPSLLANTFYGPVVNALERALKPDGFNLVVRRLCGDLEDDYQLIQGLVADGTSGVVVIGQSCGDRAVVSAIKRQTLPLILVDNDMFDLGADCVVIDNLMGIELVVDELVRSGHRRIGYIGGPLSHVSLQQRYEAFRSSMAKRGLDVDDSQICVSETGDFAVADGHRSALEILSRSKVSLTAIVAANDELAMGAMRALHERGYRVPEEISVTGFDNIEMAGHYVPSLTTVAVARAEMGLAAGARFRQLLMGEARKPVKIVASVELLTRDSVASI